MTEVENSALSGSIQSVDRALKIFKLICRSDVPLSVKEIADALGLKRPTVNGLISTLMANNFVRKDTNSGKYVQGIGAFALSHNYPMQYPRLQSIIATWESLSLQFPQTQANLGLFDGESQVVMIPLNSYSGSGAVPLRGAVDFPMHASGLGKCLLAHLPNEVLDTVIAAKGLIRYTQNTLTSKEALLENLSLIREQGYALDEAEYLENTFCVAFPVFNSAGHIAAALSFSNSKELWDKSNEAMIRTGLQTSKLCSQSLGWHLGR